LALPASNKAHRQPAISNRVEMLCSLRDISSESVRSNFNEAEKARRKLFQRGRRSMYHLSVRSQTGFCLSFSASDEPGRIRLPALHLLCYNPDTSLLVKKSIAPRLKHPGRFLLAQENGSFKVRRPLCLHLPEKCFLNSSHG
jgi:hypothetical protein